jgi:hypothetical protein
VCYASNIAQFADERIFIMAKTYIPGAVDIASKSHKYLTRYQTVLTAGASAEQITAVVELISCLANFLAKWHKPAVLP